MARQTTGEERCNRAKQKLWWLKNKEGEEPPVVFRTHTTQTRENTAPHTRHSTCTVVDARTEVRQSEGTLRG